MSPTAASVGSDINGQATLLACRQILQGLKKVAARLLGDNAKPEQISLQHEQVYLNGQLTAINWKQLISQSYMARSLLSTHTHYATPRLFLTEPRNRATLLPIMFTLRHCGSDTRLSARHLSYR